jgi:hypothetical protein
MGTFTDITAPVTRKVPKRKHKQEFMLDIAFASSDFDTLRDIIESMADSYTCMAEHINEYASATISYIARGANKSDVTRRLDDRGFHYIIKDTHTQRKCSCLNSEMSCEE